MTTENPHREHRCHSNTRTCTRVYGAARNIGHITRTHTGFQNNLCVWRSRFPCMGELPRFSSTTACWFKYAARTSEDLKNEIIITKKKKKKKKSRINRTLGSSSGRFKNKSGFNDRPSIIGLTNITRPHRRRKRNTQRRFVSREPLRATKQNHKLVNRTKFLFFFFFYEFII